MYPRPLLLSLVCSLTVALSACSGGGSSSGGSERPNRTPTLELSSLPVSPTGLTGELVEVTAFAQDGDLSDNLLIEWDIEPSGIPINGPSVGDGLTINIETDTNSGTATENTKTSVRHFHMPETDSDLTITVTATVSDSFNAISTKSLTFTARPTPESSSPNVFSRVAGWENIPAGKLVEVDAPMAADTGVTLGSIDNVPTYFVPNADNDGYLWINTGFYQGDHLLNLDDGNGFEINQVFTSNNGSAGATIQLFELSLNLQAAGFFLTQATPSASYASMVSALLGQTAIAPTTLPLNVATQIGLNLVTIGTEPTSIEAYHVSSMLATNFPFTLEAFSIPGCGGIVAKLAKVDEVLTTYADLERYAEGIPAISLDPQGNTKRTIIKSTIGGLVVKHLSAATLGLMNSCKYLVVSDTDPATDYVDLNAGELSLSSGVAANLYTYGLSGQTQTINDAVVALNATLAEHSMFNYGQLPEDDPVTDSVISAIDVETSAGAEASCIASTTGSDNVLSLTCTYTGSAAPEDAAPFDLTFSDPNGTYAAVVIEDVTFNP